MEKESILKQYNSYGLIVVKPEAFMSGIDLILTSGSDEIAQRLGSPALADFFAKLDLLGVFYRNFNNPTRYGHNILSLIYEKDQEERYFPDLIATNSGPVAILLFGSEISQSEMHILLKGIKGTPHVVNNEGVTVIEPSGVRGALTPVSTYVSTEQLDQMPDVEYSQTISPILNNTIHTSDTPEEMAMVLTHILSERSLKNINQLESGLSEFIARYYPVNLQTT